MFLVMFGCSVKFLLKGEKVDIPYPNSDALINASEKGHLEIVKILLKDKRVDPSDQNNRAFDCASWEGHLEIMELLAHVKEKKKG